MKVLYHVAEMGRFTAEEVGHINDAMAAWSDQAVAVLTSYHPGGVAPPNSSNYWLLAHWAKLSFDTVKFLLNKTKDACTLINSFKELRAAVDTLNPVLNKMSIGRATKQGAQEAAINAQDVCLASINAYFSHTLPFNDDATVVNFLQQLIADASVINEGTIAQLRAAKIGRRLQRVIILYSPVSY